MPNRCILHSDANCFYASVEMLLNPELRGKAVAVCGSTEDRHGIVLARSEKAKKAGVKTGQVNWEARQTCPGLIVVPPHYDQYCKFSRLLRNIYLRYTDLVEPYFSFPCKPTKANGGRTRNRPSDAPEKWAVYKQYNAQDVETERAIRKALEKYPLPEQEWAYYALDQQINDRGVRVDKQLVKNAIAADAVFAQAAYQRAKELTGLENPGSVMQLHGWLRERGVQLSTLLKKEVQRKLAEMDEDAQPDAQADEAAREMLRLRLEMSRSSIKKYEAMARCVCKDGRIHGMFRFYGASRTGRFASQIVNLQNLRRNDMEDLALARSLLREGRAEELSMLYASAADVLSELVRTALIARKGCRFIVADFSAIEARVLAWLAGEEWRLKVFEEGGDIYCASASQMFHVPVEKHGVNGHLRQKGKISELALGYGGSIGALQAMGSREMNIPDEELKPLVDGWRKANPRIVQFWRSVGDAAMKAVRELISMCDPQAPPSGAIGEVVGVDDTASLLVKWQTGSSLNVLYGIDRVKKI